METNNKAIQEKYQYAGSTSIPAVTYDIFCTHAWSQYIISDEYFLISIKNIPILEAMRKIQIPSGRETS